MNNSIRVLFLLLLASIATACAHHGATPMPDPIPERPDCWIGYSDMKCDDPRGQVFNWWTYRAMVVRGDLSQRKELAPSLIRDGNTWTQFAGWSRDGKIAILGNAWEDPKHYELERKAQNFILTSGWLVDACLVEIATGKITVPTAVERVSDYNSGLFFWPGDPNRLGFTGVINSESKPFSMNLDGTNKKDLSTGSAGFTYGYSASPDGKRIAYHKNYQVYLADADGGNAQKVETGDPFHFGPLWSPDGKWVVFVAGVHGKSSVTIVSGDGKELRKLAARGDYVGWIECLDTPDFHSTSSDNPVWAIDSQWMYYTADVGGAVELLRVNVDGKSEQLTHSAPGVKHYHPRVSPDGKWIAFGSTRDGARALYVARADGSDVYALTKPIVGRAQMHVHWQPR